MRDNPCEITLRKPTNLLRCYCSRSLDSRRIPPRSTPACPRSSPRIGVQWWTEQPSRQIHRVDWLGLWLAWTASDRSQVIRNPLQSNRSLRLAQVHRGSAAFTLDAFRLCLWSFLARSVPAFFLPPPLYRSIQRRHCWLRAWLSVFLLLLQDARGEWIAETLALSATPLYLFVLFSL